MLLYACTARGPHSDIRTACTEVQLKIMKLIPVSVHMIAFLYCRGYYLYAIDYENTELCAQSRICLWVSDREKSSQWPHSVERHGVSTHRYLDHLFNSLFSLTSNKISKLSLIGSLWNESTSKWWIPFTNGQWHRKHFRSLRHCVNTLVSICVSILIIN